MKVLIIPEDSVQKLRDMEFDGWNKLNPIEGEFDTKKIYFLNAIVKEKNIFAKALVDFEVCEIKDIETFEIKYFDDKDIEIIPLKELKDNVLEDVYKDDKGVELNIITLSQKIILLEKK